jgi:hypothetical protein
MCPIKNVLAVKFRFMQEEKVQAALWACIIRGRNLRRAALDAFRHRQEMVHQLSLSFW